MATIVIVPESVIKIGRKQGGLRDLNALSGILRSLGHSVVVLADLAEGTRTDDFMNYFEGAQLFEPSTLDPVLVRLRNGSPKTLADRFRMSLLWSRRQQRAIRAAITTLKPDCIIIHGFGAFVSTATISNIPKIGIVSLPPDLLILSRAGITLKNSRLGFFSKCRNLVRAAWQYVGARIRLKRLDGTLDVLLAQDPSLAIRHKSIARRRSCHYQSPLPDTTIARDDHAEGSQPLILMLGALGTHTEAGLNFFCREIAPHLSGLNQWNYRLKIIGMNSLPDYLSLPIAVAERTTFVSYLDGIEQEYQSCSCLLMCSPLAYGASTRVKLGLMCGTLCIVHSAVQIGLPELTHGGNCLMATKGEDFAKYIEMVFRQKDLKKKISANARSTYERYFTIGQAQLFWRDILDGLGIIAG